MCFELLHQVKRVENPDVTELFSGPQAALNIAVKIYLENQVVQAVTQEAAKFDRVINITYGVPLGELPDRTAIVTNPIGQRYLTVEGNVHPEQMFVSPHMGLDGKIYSLQLKDFSFLAMWSVEHTADGVELRIKFGVEAENVTTYNCTPQEYHQLGSV